MCFACNLELSNKNTLVELFEPSKLILQLYNSLSRKKEKFSPIETGRVKIYTCGPTVYDKAHIGNFRTFLFEDFLKRTLIALGYKVTHIMNITDVDDKTIQRANVSGKSLSEITDHFTELFWNDFEDPKGFHIFDTGTRELERIVNTYTLFKKIYYDDTDYDYNTHDVEQYNEKYVKLIVVNKKDLYQFDLFVDRLLKADAHEVKNADTVGALKQSCTQ